MVEWGGGAPWGLCPPSYIVKKCPALRCSVEWVFGDILNYFKFLDFHKNLKIQLSAVRKMYIVCVLLQNSRSCFYGSTTSNYFECPPPLIQEYFS